MASDAISKKAENDDWCFQMNVKKSNLFHWIDFGVAIKPQLHWCIQTVMNTQRANVMNHSLELCRVIATSNSMSDTQKAIISLGKTA